MKKSSLVILSSLVLGILVSDAGKSDALVNCLPDANPPLEIKEKKTLNQLISLTSKQFNTAIISDIYPHESQKKANTPAAQSADAAIHDIANKYEKEILRSNNTFVLRSINWPDFRNANTALDDQWTSPGTLIIKNLSSNDESEGLPAQLISIEAQQVSLSRLAAGLRAQANWDISIEPELREQRVSIYAGSINPAEIIDAIALIMDASQKIAMHRNDKQRQNDSIARSGLNKDMQKILKESNKLKSELEKIMTPEEKKKLSNKEEFSMNFSKMDMKTKDKCIKYIDIFIKTLLPKDNINIDMINIDKFRINFKNKAGSAYGVLGAMVIDDKGVQHFF